MKLRFSLLGLIGLTSLAAFACAALARPDAGWLSVIVSLTALVATLQLLRALLLPGESRAAACGWLLFACVYVALFAGPWLSANVAPALLPAKGIAYAQASWHPAQHQPEVVGWSADYSFLKLEQVTINANSGALTLVPVLASGNAIPVPTASSVGGLFVLTGHWLFAWIAGWLGAVLAVHLQRRAAAGARLA